MLFASTSSHTVAGMLINVVADVASIGESTVRLYLERFCNGVLGALRPI